MIVLTIKTDSPEAELTIYKGSKILEQETWQAHKLLTQTINKKLTKMLSNLNLAYEDLSGIIFFKGPGSFTGLRIGAAVANTLAYSLSIPVVGTNKNSWKETGLKNLQENKNDKIALPFYRSDAKTTTPRK